MSNKGRRTRERESLKKRRKGEKEGGKEGGREGGRTEGSVLAHFEKLRGNDELITCLLPLN